MAKAIGTLDSSKTFFKGFNTGIIFAALAGSETDAGDLSTPQWIGDVFQGSMSWVGDAPEITAHKNEKGELLYNLSASGSSAMQLDLASTSDTIMSTFMNGTSIITANVGAPSFIDVDVTTESAVGWGDELPVINRPFAIVNDTNDQILLFPNAHIVAQVVNNDRALHVRLTITAQTLPATATYLKPVMLVRGALELGDLA